MPNLRQLQILWYPGSTLPVDMLYNLPGLQHFELRETNVETIPREFFTHVTSCRVFFFTENKINTIDLGSLNPNSWVVLSNNQINQLPEKNFRPFVENVLNTPDVSAGIVDLDGKFKSLYNFIILIL